MKMPTSADYKAYLKGLMSQAEYEKRSKHSVTNYCNNCGRSKRYWVV